MKDENLAKPAITMEVNDAKRQDVVIRFERPARITTSVDRQGKLLVYVYEGAEDDAEQEPLFCFDGHMAEDTPTKVNF